MAEPSEIIYPFNSMETVMNKFERSKSAFLPVIKDENILDLSQNP
jgi:CIC family chloride channel protein